MTLETFKRYNPSKRSPNQKYHVKMMKNLIQDGRILQKIPNFNSESFYTRDVGKGWWMPMKQFVIISLRCKRGFDKFYINDRNPEARQVY